MEKLAINGGSRVVPEGVIKPWPWILPEDKEAVLNVLDDVEKGAHFDGKQVLALQEEWAKYLDRKYCLATNSGTAALHMAVAAAGVEPGDEVITSAFTFIASATCILHHNGIPVFVDIDPDTALINPDLIEEKITPRTKGIIPVHIHGLVADMEPIMKIARKHNLIVIEDACQAYGAKYKGKLAGTFGDMAAFSMQEFKHLPAGEGGLFVTDNDAMMNSAQMLRVFGEIIEDKAKREYNAYGMGWMYRTFDLVAALARSQLRRLDEYTEIRIRNCEYLTEHLKDIEGIEPPMVPTESKHVYWMYVFKVKPERIGIKLHPAEFRNKVQKALRAEGVPVGQWQLMPVPGQLLFQEKKGYGRGCPWTCPHAGQVEYKIEDYPQTLHFIDEYLRIGGVEAGIAPPNGLELMSYYIEAFQKVFRNIDQVLAIDVSEKKSQHTK